MEEIISAGLEELGLTGRVPEDAPAQLAQYGQMLLEKNQVMNLTAIREPEGVARLHMLDCAALLKFCDFEGKTLIDVGTGAGFPGMVLKILVPSLRITFLDSLAKRLDWLSEVYEDLGCIDSITAFHGRAEEFAAPLMGYRDSFDLVTARAVADLRVLCELCLPFVKVGGQFLAMKSTNSDSELAEAAHAIQLLGGRVAGIHNYLIPGTEITHRLIVIQKMAPTLKGHPRRWAKIQKEPL
ncbi:16S rRNA (guanine(527)-N(7))-methyltransferase RsmG [Colidextribacter sp. OB.20]|uniref:16S rRNA (guanine(527)-N(7))-methyltransferase RsmG n=1 Tax=Colidextribacter sp. OB.20 TaxID=2304568 RepID=UPI00136C5FDA|nr:16S rRNA (guanine(527)-N(7))-methyltransferase RsmG [Colidextribacter sp. OB.20]NBI08704.1 16S rRNA (guanine(527)-N(7))-methyltransferase RsmG [Colidextribacter sp. OB.20]